MSEQASEGKRGTAEPTGSTAEEALTSPTIINLTSLMTRYKRDVTVSLKNAEKQIQQIKAAMEKGQRVDSNLLLEGMLKTALGNWDNAKIAKSNLAQTISQFIGEIENVRTRFPDAKELCDGRLASAEKDEENYQTKLDDFQAQNLEFFASAKSTNSSQSSSRDNSPRRGDRRRFLQMKHLLPDTLKGECTILEFNKFKRDFGRWISSSYPDGYEVKEFHDSFMSRLDPSWQATMISAGIEEMSTETEVWEECDKCLLTSHPIHNRRICFLGQKMQKDELPSKYIARLKEEATSAKISELTESALVLHIFGETLPNTETMKPIKALVIEQLRKNPNLASLSNVITKIKGLESDHNATSNIHKVKEVKSTYDCKLCKKTHGRRECTVRCKHCRMIGSHLSENCYKKRDNKRDNKRDRSKSRDRSDRRQKKRDQSPAPRRDGARKVDRESDRESDRDSEIQDSATDTEKESSPERERVEKNSSRRIKNRVRRIGGANRPSSTMMGQVVNRNNRGILAGPKECFIPDTGTTVPIIPINIAKRNNMKINPTDSDEPGCESASGHDMEIMGQVEFFAKFDSLKRIKKVRGLVSNETGEEILLDEHTLREWSIIPKNFPEPMDERERELEWLRKTQNW